MITFDDWAKIEIKIGTIIAAERVPETDKLWKLTVDFGLKPSADGSADHPADKDDQREIRTIVSGIAPNYPEPEMLIGKQCPFITNLEPRTIKGIQSQGMILAPSDAEDRGVILNPERPVEPGAKVK